MAHNKDEELNPDEWIRERQAYYEKIKRGYIKELKGGEFNQLDDSSEQEKVDKKKRSVSIPSPTGDLTEDPPNVKNPTVMDKVEAELKKQDINEPTDRENNYKATKWVLEKKEEFLKTITGDAARRQFIDAVGINEDKKIIDEFEAEQEKELSAYEQYKEPGDIKAKDDPEEHLKKVNQSNLNRTVNIQHKGVNWTYARNGREESFTHTTTSGQPVVRITKNTPHKNFDEGKNSIVETFGDKPGKTEAYSMDLAFGLAKDKIEKFYDRDGPFPRPVGAAVPEELEKQRQENIKKAEKEKSEPKSQKEKDIERYKAKIRERMRDNFNRSKDRDKGDDREL